MIGTDTGPFAIVPLWLPAALYEARPKAGGTAIVVYVAMHRWTAGDDRTCHPTVKSIADEARVSVTACKDALKLLREVGAVSWKQRRDEHGDLTSSDYTIHTARPRSVAQATNGSGGQATNGSGGQATSNQTQSEPDPVEPDVIPPTPRKRGEVDEAFEAWWTLYPKKKAGKGQARDRWRKMTQAERAQAVEGIGRHVAWWVDHDTDEQFIPSGSVWLNQRRWEDEEPRSATVLTAVPTNDWIARSKARRAALGGQT